MQTLAATALMLGALATLPACASAPLAPRALPGWTGDAHDGLRTALQRQCASPRPPPPWPTLCAELRALAGPIGAWVERRFVATPLTDDDGNAVGLITGYYEPLLTGSRERASPSQAPLYRRPPAHVLASSPTRARIEREGLLAGQELLWVDDAVDAFFLQVQGSGRVRLRDGTTVRVGFAGDNGHPYRSIGRELIDRGVIAQADVTADAIKDWLRANPADATRLMQSNPRYIFFREIKGVSADAGPPGSLGVPLTPGRSVAVDPKRVPPGALLWLSTTHPRSAAPLQRMVLAQDTGAAIVGAVRADLFWGSGAEAGIDAGRMRHAGRLWLLRPVD
jgi:membrane-bound lytic murein transglycosylase A